MKPIPSHLPAKVGERIHLAARVAHQHQSLGTGSPLVPLDWSVIGPQITEAETLQQRIETMATELATLSSQRDALDAPVSEAILSAWTVLEGVYRSQPHMLSTFGLPIPEPPRPRGRRRQTVTSGTVPPSTVVTPTTTAEGTA